MIKADKNSYPENKFRERDLARGHVVYDSQYGYVIHTSPFSSILPDGAEIIEGP